MAKGKKYIVTVGGDGWSRGPVFEASSLREARKKIEGYGSLADWAHVENKKANIVACYQRSRSDNRWYRDCEYLG